VKNNIKEGEENFLCEKKSQKNLPFFKKKEISFWKSFIYQFDPLLSSPPSINQTKVGKAIILI